MDVAGAKFLHPRHYSPFQTLATMATKASTLEMIERCDSRASVIEVTVSRADARHDHHTSESGDQRHISVAQGQCQQLGEYKICQTGFLTEPFILRAGL